jgi:SAM-dependent methyltransferase
MNGSEPEFDRYASNYEELLRDPVRDGFVQSTEFFHRRKWILIEDFIRRKLLSPDKMAWLDVGCGKGELLTLGCSRFGRAVGCDPSIEMFRAAKDIEVHHQKSPSVLPFRSSSFDLATAVCVYHHVEEADRMSLTEEIRRVLRPNGIFCMIEHNPFNPATRLIVSRAPVDVDAHLLSLGLAKRYTKRAGMKHVESQYFLYLPEKLYDRFRNVEFALRVLPLGGQYAYFVQNC